jgi:energy-coupling factor transporter ATP-binding protein EcfA2
LAVDDQYKQFANERRAVIVGPAGCGKTELVARAVGFCPSNSKQLILTHTHAGVDSLRAKLRKLNVSSSHYHVETIHSFALRYAAAYPKSSSVKSIKPQTSEDYRDIIESAHRLMKTRVLREVFSLSYGGIFVDEYQDCTLDQHDLILRLAEVLPCRVVGDPLQGIFDFGGNQIVDWDRDVYPSFTRLPDLADPWRWKHTNPQLGRWLTNIVRPTLERKEPLPLAQALQGGICGWTQEVSGQYGPATRTKVLMDALNRDETTFVICDPVQTPLPHFLASSLKNRYHSLEAITSDELHHLAAAIERQNGMERLEAAYDFAKKCLTGQDDFEAVLDAIRTGRRVTSATRVRLRAFAERILAESSLVAVSELFEFLEKNDAPTIKRHQLWHEMRRALAEVISGSLPSLVEATYFIRNKEAVIGRRIPKRCISRTLLLKGLGCEQAIVVDADSLDTKHLYVALTRASRHLQILSKEKVLWATDARRSCSKCQSQLVLREGRNGPFLGCSSYPHCRHTESLTKTL